MRKILYIFILVFCMVISAWLIAGAADQDLFDIYTLEVEGDIYDYVTADFDGDRYTDIIVIYSPIDDFETRYIGLYLQKGSSGFRTIADYLSPLPQSASQIDVADIDGDGLAEIYLIEAERVSVIRFTPNVGFSTPEQVVRHRTIYSIPYFSGIIVEPFLFDINSQAGPEIIIPNSRGYAIFEQGDDGSYGILNQIEAPVIGRNTQKGLRRFQGRNNIEFIISLADIYVADGNGDSANDIYLLWDRKVCCFFQDQSGNFASDPDVEVDFYPVNSRGYHESLLADCNGDGSLDAVVSNTSGGITNTETKIRIHMADSQGRIRDVAVKEITLSDSHCNLMIGDYDRDGRFDMVVPAVELGALAATKMFLMKKADLHLLIYPLDNGMPGDEPARRMKYEFRFDFDDPQPTVEVALEWTADYNGDNLNDLVFSDGKGKLQFFWGQNGEYLSKKPDLEVAVDHPQEIHPFHLYNGARSDIIIEHNLSGRLDRLTILKNREN